MTEKETWQSVGDLDGRIADMCKGEMARRLSEKAEFLPIGESLIDYDDDFGNDVGDK